MDPREISIAEYDYDLPEEKIAVYPLKERDQSKLLVYGSDGKIDESIYKNLSQFLPSKSHLFFNNTKVVQARLIFKKSTGAKIEIFCLEPDPKEKDVTLAMSAQGEVTWVCLVGNNKKWKEGKVHLEIQKNGKKISVSAEKLERYKDAFLIKFNWSPNTLSFSEILELSGETPLPPYMNRKSEESDKERYQTIFAEHDGSVAAPTASLHFSNSLLDSLKKDGVKFDYLTLHVGAGTFKPVSSEKMGEHEMHAEFIDVSISTIKNIQENPTDFFIPVGTTSLRTLESLYWLGVKCTINPNISNEDLFLTQWEAYDLDKNNVPLEKALKNLMFHMEHQGINKLLTKTQLIITPGYKFRVAKGLLTNFHQPKSTLLLIVSALIGQDWKTVYDHALKNDYRFLSYGDGCLLIGR